MKKKFQYSDDEFIGLIKSIITESIDFSGDDVFTPEMYYFIILYIMDAEFDFYSDDIFKFFLFKGYIYFKDKHISESSWTYIKIFEHEIDNWETSILYNDFENIIIEMLKAEKWKIINNLQDNNYSSNNIEYHINEMAVEMNKKYLHDRVESGGDIIEKLFDMF